MSTMSRIELASQLAKAGGFHLWLKVGLACGLLTVLYADVIPAMVWVWWNDPGYSHGMLIPPLALYISWLHRQELFAEPAVEDHRGLWVTGLGALVYLAGKLGAEFFLTRVSLVIILAGIVWTFWGLNRLRVLAFPLFLLVTMVPIPAIVYNKLAAPLQLFASSVATGFLQLFSVPVYRDGNIIHLAQTSLGVAEACSGLRTISSLAVLSLVVGYFHSPSFSVRTILFALAIPTAIAVNVVRIVGTAFVARQNPELAEGFYHSFSGWLVFLLGFGILYLFATLLGRLFQQKTP